MKKIIALIVLSCVITSIAVFTANAAQFTFKDVKTTDYFYQPALWAYEKGIVSGNVLSPNNKCTRGETVIYLYKSAGSPESDQINQFIDVPASDVALNTAVCWAYVNNITGGTSYTTFSPKDTCTRGHIVTFLYRAFK